MDIILLILLLVFFVLAIIAHEYYYINIFASYKGRVENFEHYSNNRFKRDALISPGVAFNHLFQTEQSVTVLFSKLPGVMLIAQFFIGTSFFLVFDITPNDLVVLMGILISITHFFVSKRVWSYKQMKRLLVEKDQLLDVQIAFENEMEVFKENHKAYLDTKKEYEQLSELVEKKKEEQKKLQSVSQNYLNKIHEKECELSNEKELIKENLASIMELPDDIEIAIDSNVLMKWDDYIIEALKRKNVLISKNVQEELDQNKNSQDQSKGYRARRAIRKLLQFSSYRFTVSKWTSNQLLQWNLKKGSPDDEIIADYLYEKERGTPIVILSDDHNFLISAKVHFETLTLKKPSLFSNLTEY